MADGFTLDVEAADVLRLVQAHLTECGLHETCRVLREESGVAAAGVVHSNFKSWATNGQWGMILDNLSTLDPQRSRIPRGLLADVHEMAILELAEMGEVELAYATLRLSADELDAVGWSETTPVAAVDAAIPRSRLLEQRLAALSSLRASSSTSMQQQQVPSDFYGSLTKQERRKDIGNRLAETVPIVPASRLSALLQQAIKWQAHTGTLPMVRSHWEQDDVNDDGTKRKTKRRKKEFDLVLGEVDAPSAIVTEATRADEAMRETIPSKPYSTIKFGKKATAECSIFLPDGSGLVTGSSDGLIEIWDAKQKFSKLRMDLSYQESEDLLWHSTAVMSVAVSNDGTLLASGGMDGMVKLWRIDTGKCLREIVAHDKAVVSCLAFSNDGTHLLSASHDATCREFGLRTSRMLKQFRGHDSYVNSCYYSLVDCGAQLRVITGSADGTVRVFDGKSTEVLHVLGPVSWGSEISTTGSSVLMDRQADSSSEASSPNVHSVLPLHTPTESMIIVPRGRRAFLSDYRGKVIRTFDVDSSGKVFVAATVSPSNRWLYAVTDLGSCCIFDVQTGALETTIRDFASAGSSTRDGSAGAELSGLLHHPLKGIVAAFSNDKTQKRGIVTVWK